MENTITPENQFENERPQRPQFLTVLCILSFIWSGFLLFCLFLLLIFSSSIFSVLEKLLVGADGMPPISEDQQKALQTLLDLGPQKFLMMVSITSAVLVIVATMGYFYAKEQVTENIKLKCIQLLIPIQDN